MSDYKRTFRPPPESACPGGLCSMGNYSGMIPRPDLLQASRPLGKPYPRFINNLRLKEWEAFQLVNREWFLCLAVYNAKLTGIVIIMAYNIRENRMYRYEKKVPPWQLHVPCGLGRSRCHYYSRNFNIDVFNHLDEGTLEMEFSAWDFPGLPSVSGSVKARRITRPLVILHPFAANRPLYSHKELMAAEGSLKVGEVDSEFDGPEGILILDDHKGYYPRTMQYDWITAAGVTPQGEPAGINLTHNQIRDPEEFNENGLWKGESLYPLPPVTFDRPDGVMGSWKIRDNRGWVELDFQPAAEVPILFDLGLIRSDYHGVFGTLSGTISHPDTGDVRFTGFTAMGEKKLITL